VYVAFLPSMTCVGDALMLPLGARGIAEQSPGPAVLLTKPETVPLNGEDTTPRAVPHPSNSRR
jgi:hypothetical protein